MNRYKNKLSEYCSGVNEFNRLMVKLSANVKADKEGLFTELTQFSHRLYELRDSICYRLSAVTWHLKNLCSQHSHFEKRFKGESQNQDVICSKQYQYFLFDDFIFNLISLYDFYGNFIGLSFINVNKPKMGWGSLAKSALDKTNPFSKTMIGQNIAEHEKTWVQNLRNFRAEIIHYNFSTGNSKSKISWTKGERVKYQLMYSIPDKLVKLLKLSDCAKNEVGVDLQFGALEIGKRSISFFRGLTDLANKTCTQNYMNVG